jgi:hypothetical protein
VAHIDDHLLDAVKNSWSVPDQKTNDVAIATTAAIAGRHHVIFKVDASYSTATVDGEITILFGVAVVARKQIHGAGAIDFGIFGFQNPTVNQAVSAQLTAGGVGVDGDVNMSGYTTGPNN